MSDPYYGEIRIFAGNFAPVGWQFCQGQLLAISENVVLFTLIGTTYGGDGVQTFALPNLSGRIPVGIGNGFQIGDSGGFEQVNLAANHVPAHTHTLAASAAAATVSTPAGSVVANTGVDPLIYQTAAAADVSMNAAALLPVGTSEPHENRMAYLAINYIICMSGIFPSQS